MLPDNTDAAQPKRSKPPRGKKVLDLDAAPGEFLDPCRSDFIQELSGRMSKHATAIYHA